MTRDVTASLGGGSMVEVWVLGGSGRTGRAVADDLAAGGIEPVMVGRDAARLGAASRESGHRVVVAPTVPAMAAGVVAARPAVVLNTIGPFTTTAQVLVDACLAAGSDYVDLANDMA